MALEQAWSVLKEKKRPLECPNCDAKIDDTGEPSYPIPDKDETSSTGYRCWKCRGEV